MLPQGAFSRAQRGVPSSRRGNDCGIGGQIGPWQTGGSSPPASVEPPLSETKKASPRSSPETKAPPQGKRHLTADSLAAGLLQFALESLNSAGDATISFGLPLEPGDCQYGKSRSIIRPEVGYSDYEHNPARFQVLPPH